MGLKERRGGVSSSGGDVGGVCAARAVTGDDVSECPEDVDASESRAAAASHSSTGSTCTALCTACCNADNASALPALPMRDDDVDAVWGEGDEDLPCALLGMGLIMGGCDVW